MSPVTMNLTEIRRIPSFFSPELFKDQVSNHHKKKNYRSIVYSKGGAFPWWNFHVSDPDFSAKKCGTFLQLPPSWRAASLAVVDQNEN